MYDDIVQSLWHSAGTMSFKRVVQVLDLFTIFTLKSILVIENSQKLSYSYFFT